MRIDRFFSLIRDYPEKLFRLLFFIGTALLIFLSLCNILGGVLYDTDHFGDTLFILGTGWRTHEGLRPVLDFGDFYGGAVAEGLAMTMRLFGTDVFTLERFALLSLACLVLVAAIILNRRISMNGFMALVLTLAVLMLSRYPLELNEPIIRIVSTHSFFYNRFGLALLLVSGLFVALRAPTERHDLLPGVLLGFLVVVAALTKPTFIVLMLGVLIGLTLQQRWQALAAVVVGIAVSVTLLDPTLQKWTGSLAYIQAQIGDQENADIGALLRKAVQIPLYQPVATIFALALVGVLIVAKTQIRSLMALLTVAGVGIGMATTMGGNGSIGQLALPVAILTALAAGEIAAGAKLRNAQFLQMVAYALVISLALPHMLNQAGATVEGLARSNQTLISQGPYARYLSIPEKTELQSAHAVPPQYEMFADGIATLHGLGNPSRWGIIADNGITFEYAVLGRPVPGYPLWQRATAPELAADKPIAPEADIVMIGRSDPPSDIGAILMTKLGADFSLCMTSVYWYVYARISSGIQCQEN